jgi:predicted small integral membrane protein
MLLVRLAKAVMVAGLAVFALVVTYDNIVDYGSNYEFVKHVLSMDTTLPGNRLMHRAITDEAVWHAAYAAIIATEGLAGLLLAFGAAALLAALRAPAERFNRAKAWTAAGVAVAFGLWFIGFQVVAGEYFAMWQSRTWNGQEAAFRFTMTMLGVLIFVNQRDGELRP